MDMGLNPKDLRIDEQIAIEYTNEFIENKKNYKKKNFHYLDSNIIEAYTEAKSDSSLQAQIVRESNKYEEHENNMFNHNRKDFDDR